MVDSPVLERAAHLIAENAVLAFERERDEAWFHPTGRASAIATLARELLDVMPTSKGSVLADACNRGLDQCDLMDGPRIGMVDVNDGSVTMRAAGS